MANETMVLLEKIVVPAAGASSITFTSIPQSYTDLKIVVSARNDDSNSAGGLFYVGLNGVSTNLSSRVLYGYGSGAGSLSSTAASAIFGYTTSSGSTASTFGNAEIYIPNYTSSNNKSISVDAVNENNATDGRQNLVAGLWSSSSAITSVTLYSARISDGAASGSFVQYSTFYLYGVAKQGVTPTNAPAATGGDKILFDGTYWYHVFTSTGTFTPKKNLTADCLVIAGGGAGSGRWGAGGGAGGLQYTAAQSFASGTNYTTTIGAGGSYVINTRVSGSNSNITGGSLSLTAAVGGGGAGTRAGATQAGASGGSGGGAVGLYGGSTNAGGTATSGQGNAGGSSSVNYAGMAGGGGAGAAAANVTGGDSTAGGVGSSAYSSWGLATSTGQLSGGTYYYAGGGGGGGKSNPATNGAAGGLGGGGAGGNGSDSAPETPGTAGTANTGGGGGGGSNGPSNTGDGASGGSGIIIIRYAA
jgi:hypothetical protein